MLDVVFNILTALINILPASPFLAYAKFAEGIDLLGYLNWFVPFDIFALMLESWIVCMGLYYSYRISKSSMKH
ncbi:MULTISPECIES: hypothetical protein [Blautia]|uniref:hypothetical protein n=1 Tax=Blautia TaxID=572511 RepID=UPI000BA3A80B|nr:MULTISPECIES: hypothetical protein [Blautia]